MGVLVGKEGIGMKYEVRGTKCEGGAGLLASKSEEAANFLVQAPYFAHLPG